MKNIYTFGRVTPGIEPPFAMHYIRNIRTERKTTEEAAENYGWSIKRNIFSDPVKANELADSAKEDFIKGANWQKERSYSEEEVKDIVEQTIEKFYKHIYSLTKVEMKKEWFKQFKKK